MLKALENFAVEKITTLANKIYESGELTSQMSKSVFITIQKVQGTLECEKHSTISIMSQVTKILLRVVLSRIKNKIRPQISERISNEITLERMNPSKEIMKQIRQKQLRFLGHILKEQKLESRDLTETSGKRRPKGRPR